MKKHEYPIASVSQDKCASFPRSQKFLDLPANSYFVLRNYDTHYPANLQTEKWEK